MIRLRSNPSEEAIARLGVCKQAAQEAQEEGRALPKNVADCYRHSAVKQSIVRETYEKCAYCESKISHVYWGDVEHIKPKERFPDHRLEYENLTLACAVCNNNKRDYHNDNAPILNPYSDIPEDHLVGLGTLVWHRNGSPVGQRTIDLLDLNRVALSERREECLKRVSALADRYINEPEGPVRNTLLAQLREETSSSAEYALAARSFLLASHNIRWETM